MGRNKTQRIEDDRTEEQKLTHKTLVFARDTFLSGWGECEGGISYCAWACEDKDIDKVLEWVRKRSDMTRVCLKEGDYKPQLTKNSHFHIYVVEDGHPALFGWKVKNLTAHDVETGPFKTRSEAVDYLLKNTPGSHIQRHYDWDKEKYIDFMVVKI